MGEVSKNLVDKKYNFSTRVCWNRDIFWYDISIKCITKLKYQDWRFDFYFLMHLIFGCFFAGRLEPSIFTVEVAIGAPFRAPAKI